MICQSLSCGVLAWFALGLLGAVSVSIVGIECDVLGIGRLVAPEYHTFFAVLPSSGRRIWRATVLSCAALIAGTALAASFYADLWPVLMWLTTILSPVLLLAAGATIVWAAFKSANRD